MSNLIQHHNFIRPIWAISIFSDTWKILFNKKLHPTNFQIPGKCHSAISIFPLHKALKHLIKAFNKQNYIWKDINNRELGIVWIEWFRFNLNFQRGELNWLVSFSLPTNADRLHLCKILFHNLTFVRFSITISPVSQSQLCKILNHNIM